MAKTNWIQNTHWNCWSKVPMPHQGSSAVRRKARASLPDGSTETPPTAGSQVPAYTPTGQIVPGEDALSNDCNQDSSIHGRTSICHGLGDDSQSSPNIATQIVFPGQRCPGTSSMKTTVSQPLQLVRAVWVVEIWAGSWTTEYYQICTELATNKQNGTSALCFAVQLLCSTGALQHRVTGLKHVRYTLLESSQPQPAQSKVWLGHVANHALECRLLICSILFPCFAHVSNADQSLDLL